VLVENPLSPGQHRFELVVVDDSDNASAPAQLVVTVLNPPPPPPTPTGGGGRVGPRLDVVQPVGLDPNLVNRIRPVRPNG
jgi:hypothetical protein